MRVYAKIFLSIVFYTILCSQVCYSQKYVSDSTEINFGTDTTNLITLNIDSVVDMRDNLHGSQIKITEFVHYVFIPVDFFYVTKTDLSNEIHSIFSGSDSSAMTYKLVIRRFEIGTSEGFVTTPVLISQIEVYSGINSKNKQFVGTLIYEKTGKKPAKHMEKVFYEILIELWKKDFAKDIIRLDSTQSNKRNIAFSNFIPSPYKVRELIFSQASYLIGENYYQLDIDLGFYNPESTIKFNRHTWFFRYRNEKRFESVAFGSRSYHWYKRINENFVVDLEQKNCVGVNRWKDIKTYEHKLYDIVNVNAGIKAGIYYMPFGKRTVVAGLTTSQDLIYIFCMDAFFRSSIGISIGINF